MNKVVLEIEEQHKIGQPILEELFKLNDKDLKAKLKSICGSHINEDDEGLFGENSEVVRTIKNDTPSNMKVNFYYVSIEISFLGIYFLPEMGYAKRIVEFNKHFKL